MLFAHFSLWPCLHYKQVVFDTTCPLQKMVWWLAKTTSSPSSDSPLEFRWLRLRTTTAVLWDPCGHDRAVAREPFKHQSNSMRNTSCANSFIFSNEKSQESGLWNKWHRLLCLSSQQTPLETVHWMNTVLYGTFPDLNPYISFYTAKNRLSGFSTFLLDNCVFDWNWPNTLQVGYTSADLTVQK